MLAVPVNVHLSLLVSNIRTFSNERILPVKIFKLNLWICDLYDSGCRNNTGGCGRRDPSKSFSHFVNSDYLRAGFGGLIGAGSRFA
jgi:hypothetical protein